MSKPKTNPKVYTNIYDLEEIHHNCTVQVLRNSVTGEVSVGWVREGAFPDKSARDVDVGAYDTLNILSGAYWGKQYYFLQDNGLVYSRDSGKYMTLDDAITEFANRIGDDGSI